jgi:hypothetical protein
MLARNGFASSIKPPIPLRIDQGATGIATAAGWYLHERLDAGIFDRHAAPPTGPQQRVQLV